MRKIIKAKWGYEAVYAQEEWFTGSYMEIGSGRSTPYKTAAFDIIYDILDGTVRFTINGRVYDFSTGKTVSIKKGTKYSIMGVTVSKINKVAKFTLKDEDFTPYG